ncbi:MAG: hypothetical protein LBT30_04935 [Clostridiales bacterium]|nr:hypothetical protein [Clostridiales bacterium]
MKPEIQVKKCPKCGCDMVYDGMGLEVECDGCGYSLYFSDFENNDLDAGVFPFAGDLDDYIELLYGNLLFDLEKEL